MKIVKMACRHPETPLPHRRRECGRRTEKAVRRGRVVSVVIACVQRIALRLIIGGLLAGAVTNAGAVVFTTDYDRLTVLPALAGGGTSQDWRAHGAVTPVKNEGACDASWAFAVTGLVEGDNAIRAGTLRSLSEQELLDCTGSPSGCGGGSPIDALRTLIAKDGLPAESSYPYTARTGVCKASIPVATIPGAGRVPHGDEMSLQGYVDQGPVLALIDASQPSFADYNGGVYSEPACRTDNPTRAVLIVGYGASSGQDYWIVKNSMGTLWGASGYIYMSRNNNNNCGIASFALAVSNDPLPRPIPPAILPVPTLGAWDFGFLLLGFAALGFLTLRQHAD
jgi:C1A family cysteine protease